MSDAPYPGWTYTLPPPNYEKLKDPSIILQYPVEFYDAIGRMILAWGQYERLFTHILTGLVQETNDDSEPNWNYIDYKRRRKYFRKLVSRYFFSHAKLVKYLHDIVDRSSSIHHMRNSIVHGKQAMRLTSLPDGAVDIKIIIKSKLNSAEKEYILSADDIDSIVYDILHLSGKLNIKSHSKTPNLSSRDKAALLKLRSLVPLGTILPE